MPSDREIMDWIEKCHGLHTSVETTYVVDGYQVEILRDYQTVIAGPWHGATLREACAKAMSEWNKDA